MISKYNPKYKREAKSKDKFEKIKSEVKEKFDQEHTFKPQVNYVFTVKDKYNESKEDVYKRLSTPKIVEINKRLKEKDVIESQKMSEECTFKPKISLKNETNDREKVTTRLYKLAEQMREKREKMKREHQDNEVGKYSFNPQTDENSKQLMLKYGNKPLHERVYIIL